MTENKPLTQILREEGVDALRRRLAEIEDRVHREKVTEVAPPIPTHSCVEIVERDPHDLP